MRRRNIRTQLIKSRRRTPTNTSPTTARPVLKPTLNQADANQHHSGARHDGREDAQHRLGRDEGDEHLEQRADGRGANQCAVAVRAGQLGAVGGGGAKAVGVHLFKSLRSDGDGGEGDADDGDDAGANVVSYNSPE